MANELFPGSQTVVYVQKETTYGSHRDIVGADAFRTISESISPAEEREVRPDRSGSADHLERYIGRKSVDFEVTKLILPSGSVTAEPDDTFLWENAFGRLSLGATSIEYIMATAHTDSLHIRRGIRTGGEADAADFQEHINGAIVNRVEISWGNQGNNGLAQVTFGGMAKDWGHTGNSSINLDKPASVGTGSGNLSVANAKQFSPGSIVKFGVDTAGGSGILIDSVNYTDNLIAYSNTLDATHSHGATITPYNPTETTGGSPLHARLGFLSLDGSTSQIDHLGGTVTVEDNRSLLNEEVGYSSASRVLRTDRRNVTFALDFIMKKDEVGALLGDMTRDTAKDMQVNIGDAANKTMKLDMANARLDMVGVEIPDQDMMRISMTGRALGTNGNDSLKVRIL